MNAVVDYTGPLPAGWTGGAAKSKWWRGKTVHLYTLKKPCAQCGKEMSIDVTRSAIEGTAKNAGLKLKRCQHCRSNDPPANSRPLAKGPPPMREPEPAPPGIEEQYRTTIATMTEELNALHAMNRELRERLAKYELPEALRAMANGAPVHKMPWES
jgi:hypothetical protein